MSIVTKSHVLNYYPAHEQDKVISVGVPIRECGSTLYVGMAHTAPHTYTIVMTTFLLTRLPKALYDGLYLTVFGFLGLAGLAA